MHERNNCYDRTEYGGNGYDDFRHIDAEKILDQRNKE